MRKIKKNEIKKFSRKCNSNVKDGKLWRSDSQANKYKIKQIKICSEKGATGTILILNKKNFEDKPLSHELFLTKRQAAKTKNTFANNMTTDINLSKAQISKIIQSGESSGSWLGNLTKKVLRNIDIPLALTVGAGKGFTLFIPKEDLNGIIKIIKSLEDLGVLIDGVAETVKNEIKNKKADFLELC